jgi:hypothetical protein
VSNTCYIHTLPISRQLFQLEVKLQIYSYVNCPHDLLKYLDAGLLARSQYPEVIGHLGTGFSVSKSKC